MATYNTYYNTYNGWKLRGRQVMEGERGLFRNEYGDWMFSLGQTMVRRCKCAGRFI